MHNNDTLRSHHMFYLFWFLVFGFIYAWIAGLVAKEEVRVLKGVLILFLTGIVSIGLRIAAPDMFLGEEGAFMGAGVNFVVLAVLTKIFTGFSVKHCLIIAGIFTILLLIVAMGLSAAMQPA